MVAAHPERAFLFIERVNDQTVVMHHGLDLRAPGTNPRNELCSFPDAATCRPSPPVQPSGDSA